MEEVSVNNEPPQDSVYKESLTIEQVVDKTVKRLNLPLFLLYWAALSTALNSGAVAYVTVITGNIPYKDWKCTSDKCASLHAEMSEKEDFFTQKTMCDNEMEAGMDFIWTTSKITFTTDWNIYCKEESRLATISGSFFIGAIAGLLCSTGLFDRIGRKKGAIVGGVITIVATAASCVAPNYQALLAFRIISGFGLLINYTGVYCWVIEYAPMGLRNVAAGFFNISWSISYLILVLLGYLIDDWKYLYLALTAVCVISTAMFFVVPLPESPRFHLVRGMEKEAKENIISFFQITRNEFSFDSINLVYEERAQNYLEQLSDFKKYPCLLKRALLCMACWFLVSLITYAYTVGWSKIGSDLFTSYLFAALGDAFGYVSAIPICRLLGRKRATICLFGGIAVMNFFAMLNVDITDTWTIEQIASLLGSVATSGTFSMVYLYTGELAPTSHRGMIVCLSSSCARLGSIFGAYVSLLYGVTDRRVPLALFSGLSVCGCVAVLFLPDTTGKGIPETPKDVVN
ncbi:organic cation/carnitine transporter 2-like [Bolinopsis microptera]|uniref:organic cation/carnitine transporter 2-like n=1 Tax=Bolinopsis microptera TaxID=2820187 RepID=UPI003079BD92